MCVSKSGKQKRYSSRNSRNILLYDSHCDVIPDCIAYNLFTSIVKLITRDETRFCEWSTYTDKKPNTYY